MSYRWMSLAYVQLFTASYCLAQATAPMNMAMPQVQEDVPGRAVAFGPRGDWNPGKYVLPGFTCPDQNETTIRLDTEKEILALLLDPTQLQKLLAFEDTQFAGKDPAEKLDHRTNTLNTAITQLKGAAR